MRVAGLRIACVVATLAALGLHLISCKDAPRESHSIDSNALPERPGWKLPLDEVPQRMRSNARQMLENDGTKMAHFYGLPQMIEANVAAALSRLEHCSHSELCPPFTLFAIYGRGWGEKDQITLLVLNEHRETDALMLVFRGHDDRTYRYCAEWELSYKDMEALRPLVFDVTTTRQERAASGGEDEWACVELGEGRLLSLPDLSDVDLYAAVRDKRNGVSNFVLVRRRDLPAPPGTGPQSEEK